MEYELFNTDMIADLKNLPASDRETIMKCLHTAIADNESKVIIPLNYFRDGNHVCVFNADYMDLYNAFKR